MPPDVIEEVAEKNLLRRTPDAGWGINLNYVFI